MAFRPYPTISGFISLGVTVIAGFVAIYLIDWLIQRPELPGLFGLLMGLLLTLAVLLSALYWTIIAFKLNYFLNRNGLAIQWGLSQYLVPFEQIKTIVPGKNSPQPPAFKGIKIAGLCFGWGHLAEYGQLRFHTTATFAESLVIVTADESYVISPDKPDEFIEAWQLRQAVGPTQHWSTSIRRNWLLNNPLLTDKLVQFFCGLAALLCLALLGYLALIFAGLPASLPIHFDALGQADRTVEKSTLLLFPAIGAIVLGFNTLVGILIYYKEKVAAYLLWGGAVVMQVSIWVALLHITA